MNLFKILFLFFYIIFISGCSSRIGMALNESEQNIVIENDSILLFKINIVNEYKDYPPKITTIGISNTNERFIFNTVDGFHQNIGNKGNSYLISLKLKPGNYSKLKIEGIASGFLIMGKFNFLPDYNFNIKESQVLYLGELNATNIEKTKEYERRSGPRLPLIDQAVTGFSGGTFKLDLLNNYESNIADFRAKYPSLKNEEIYKLESNIF
jgi:hypothetical protein